MAEFLVEGLWPLPLTVTRAQKEAVIHGRLLGPQLGLGGLLGGLDEERRSHVTIRIGWVLS
jgi:hypothetical protein